MRSSSEQVRQVSSCGHKISLTEGGLYRREAGAQESGAGARDLYGAGL